MEENNKLKKQVDNEIQDRIHEIVDLADERQWRRENFLHPGDQEESKGDTLDAQQELTMLVAVKEHIDATGTTDAKEAFGPIIKSVTQLAKDAEERGEDASEARGAVSLITAVRDRVAENVMKDSDESGNDSQNGNDGGSDAGSESKSSDSDWTDADMSSDDDWTDLG